MEKDCCYDLLEMDDTELYKSANNLIGYSMQKHIRFQSSYFSSLIQSYLEKGMALFLSYLLDIWLCHVVSLCANGLFRSGKLFGRNSLQWEPNGETGREPGISKMFRG